MCKRVKWGKDVRNSSQFAFLFNNEINNYTWNEINRLENIFILSIYLDLKFVFIRERKHDLFIWKKNDKYFTIRTMILVFNQHNKFKN